MWRFRDRERFIGGYDPEHEMPDPRRDPRDRWQSDTYRHNARDSRFAYRWDPDRVESRRYEGDHDRSWNFDRNADRDRGWDDRGFRGDYGSDYGAGDYGARYGGAWYRGRSDREQGGYGYGPDRGWDRDRGFGFRDRDWDRDRDRGYDRGYDRGFDEDRDWRRRRY